LISSFLLISIAILFAFSHVHQLADSNYSMLVSQSLLQHRSFTLDHYAIARLPAKQQFSYVSVGDIYQLEYVDNHIYYFYPPGTSVLSLPFVALMNAAGIFATNPDGSYSPDGEIKIQARLAALLMALLAVIFYLTSRLMLSRGWSAFIAVAGALGTQIWSTASRALWSDTWGIFLIGLVVFMLVAHERKQHALRPVLIATLLAWSYFVRPTFCVPILAITIYLMLFCRELLLPYVVTGLAWLGVFVGYSWIHYKQTLPNYYFMYKHFTTSTFGTALAGNLISPSRGLFVFVPVLFFVAYLLTRYWSGVQLTRLAVLAIGIVVVHLFVVSAQSPWYGGHCYGPRYSTGIVPWLFLLALLAVTSWRMCNARQDSQLSRLRIESFAGIVLLMLSITVNALGATQQATWFWNVRPINVDEQPDRVWDWRHPQFLAKWIR
jgi:hypothetical protein